MRCVYYYAMAMGQAEGASLRWLHHGDMEGGRDQVKFYQPLAPRSCPLRNLFFDAAAASITIHAFEWFKSGSRPILFPFPFGPSFYFSLSFFKVLARSMLGGRESSSSSMDVLSHAHGKKKSSLARTSGLSLTSASSTLRDNTSAQSAPLLMKDVYTDHKNAKGSGKPTKAVVPRHAGTSSAASLARAKSARKQKEEEVAAAAARIKRLMEEAEKADRAIEAAKRKTAAVLAARARADEAGVAISVAALKGAGPNMPHAPPTNAATTTTTTTKRRPPSARKAAAAALSAPTSASRAKIKESSAAKASPKPSARSPAPTAAATAVSSRKIASPAATKAKTGAKTTATATATATTTRQTDVRVHVIAGLGWGSQQTSKEEKPPRRYNAAPEPEPSMSAEAEADAAAAIAAADGSEALRLLQERALLRSSCGSRASGDGMAALEKLMARYGGDDDDNNNENDAETKDENDETFSFKLDLAAAIQDPEVTTPPPRSPELLSHRSNASEAHYAPDILDLNGS